MTSKNTIIETIHLGLRRGYNRNLQLRNKWVGFEDKMIEYLLTVFVAIELNEFNGFGRSVDIQLEYSLYQFYNNAFCESKWSNEDDFFAEAKYLTRDFTTDPSQKRIDIAVMFDDNTIWSNYRSLCGLEIKAINTNYAGIETDLGRLSKSMTTKTNATGDNSIESCYSAFIKSYSNKNEPTTKTELDKMRTAVKNKVEKILNDKFRTNPDYSNLVYTIYYDDIESETIESLHDRVSHIPDYDLSWDPKNETGEVLSVVIEIKRK